MTSSSTSAGHPGVPRGWLLAAGLVALSSGCTSLVVVVIGLGNATGVMGLPSFPAGYDRFSQWLYGLFQWYCTRLAPRRANPQGSVHVVSARLSCASRAPITGVLQNIYIPFMSFLRRLYNFGFHALVILESINKGTKSSTSTHRVK